MKQLTDRDLEKMIQRGFSPDIVSVKKQVRCELKLSQRMPPPAAPIPKTVRLDLHNHTEEQAWKAINALLVSGSRNAQIITGASGILKIKFLDWITRGILADKIACWELINNGCYEIKIKKKQSDFIQSNSGPRLQNK